MPNLVSFTFNISTVCVHWNFLQWNSICSAIAVKKWSLFCKRKIIQRVFGEKNAFENFFIPNFSNVYLMHKVKKMVLNRKQITIKSLHQIFAHSWLHFNCKKSLWLFQFRNEIESIFNEQSIWLKPWSLKLLRSKKSINLLSKK